MFSDRLNRLAPAFQVLAEHWLSIIEADGRKHIEHIVDFCPVILVKVAHSEYAKIDGKLYRKVYNSSRKEWYYGLKLHAFVARKPGQLPIPLSVMVTGAPQHDSPGVF